MSANDIKAVLSTPRVLSSDGDYAIQSSDRDKLCFLEDGRLLVAEAYRRDPAVLAYEEFLRRDDVEFRVCLSTVAEIQDLYFQGGGIDKSDTTQRQEQVLRLIAEGVRVDASDIHFRNDEQTEVFMRVDGFFEKYTEFKREDGRELCRSMYQSMTDVAEESYYENRSQKGRIASTFLQKFGLTGARIGSRTTDNGNVVVLRLLKKSEQRDLPDLGYLPEQEVDIERMIVKPFGINIFSGPTGSGKSTTLEVVLQKILKYHNHKINVMTVEDPPEYLIPGVVQTVLKCDSEDTESVAAAWSNAISELLRLDPDNIMIGEIRDLESARAAFRASMTGHGVWTTVHANHALQVLDRLTDLGVSPTLVSDASNLTGLVNQSLVVRNCPHCARSYASAKHTLPKDVQRRVEQYCNVEGVKVRGRNRGCPHCGGRGYKGRQVVAETVVPNQKLMNVYRKAGSAAARHYWLAHMGGISKCAHLKRLVSAGFVDPLFGEQQVCTLDYDDLTAGEDFEV